MPLIEDILAPIESKIQKIQTQAEQYAAQILQKNSFSVENPDFHQLVKYQHRLRQGDVPRFKKNLLGKASDIIHKNGISESHYRDSAQAFTGNEMADEALDRFFNSVWQINLIPYSAQIKDSVSEWYSSAQVPRLDVRDLADMLTLPNKTRIFVDYPVMSLFFRQGAKELGKTAEEFNAFADLMAFVNHSYRVLGMVGSPDIKSKINARNSLIGAIEVLGTDNPLNNYLKEMSEKISSYEEKFGGIEQKVDYREGIVSPSKIYTDHLKRFDYGKRFVNPKLLVVDNFDNYVAFEEGYKKLGFSPSHVSSLQQARKEVGDCQVVLLDIDIGHSINGVQFSEEIMRCYGKDGPLVMLYSFNGVNEQQNIMKLQKNENFLGLVSKEGFEPWTLAKAVKKYYRNADY
jgi:hypothetical protein